MSQRDKRALLLLAAAAVAVLIFQYGFPARPEAAVATATSAEIGRLERSLRELQETGRQKPRAAAEAEAAARALAETEKGLLKGATPALASAEMQQVLKELLGAQGINMQGSEFGTVKAVGEDYAQVPLTVVFSCAIEQWINLMAALRNAPQILSSQEVRLTPGDQKNKLMHVRMVVAGYIPASLLAGAKGTVRP